MHAVISLFQFSLMDRVTVTGNVKSRGWMGNCWPLESAGNDVSAILIDK